MAASADSEQWGSHGVARAAVEADRLASLGLISAPDCEGDTTPYIVRGWKIVTTARGRTTLSPPSYGPGIVASLKSAAIWIDEELPAPPRQTPPINDLCGRGESIRFVAHRVGRPGGVRCGVDSVSRRPPHYQRVDGLCGSAIRAQCSHQPPRESISTSRITYISNAGADWSESAICRARLLMGVKYSTHRKQ